MHFFYFSVHWTSYLVWWPSNPCGFNILNQAKIGKWGLLASGFYEQTCRCPKVFKRDFKFNLSQVLSPHRRLNFTLWELILPDIAILLWKIHPCLNLQHSFSLFSSALPNVRPTKGNLVYISQHSICFHLWHALNNPCKLAPCYRQCHTSHLVL